MKPIKLLLLGLALISATLITTGKTFGSPGVHKDSVKIEIFKVAAMTAAAADHSFIQAGEINFCLAVTNLELFQVLRPIEGFLPILDAYRSDHYQEIILTLLNDERHCPALRLNPDNPIQRI